VSAQLYALSLRELASRLISAGLLGRDDAEQMAAFVRSGVALVLGWPGHRLGLASLNLVVQLAVSVSEAEHGAGEPGRLRGGSPSFSGTTAGRKVVP
jgi:hypothetical protein